MTQTSLPGESAEPTASAPPPRPMRRVGMASLVGTTIEFYDFLIFATAAALVFPKVFFPALGPAAATVASFATLGVAFVARPAGSVIFGRFGDRLGRKKTLIVTLLLMGLSTLAVGLVPSTGQIGAVAPILIVVLRVVQGLAVGGEWAGAVLFSAEYAPKRTRAFWANLPSLGGACGTVLANVTFLVFSVSMTDEQFLNWGWRLPFIASIVLVMISLWIRLSIEETPVFRDQQSRAGVSRRPFVEALRQQPREMFLAAGMIVAIYAFMYIGTAYLTSYATSTLALSKTSVLIVGIGGGIALGAGQLVGAYWSDRIGRRKVMLAAFAFELVWALALFPFIGLDSVLTFGIGVCLTLFVNGIATGPLGAYLSENFHTRYRYTAAGFCYNVAGILGAAVLPLVASAVIASSGTLVFSLILAVTVVFSLWCVWSLAETRTTDLDRTPAG